MKPLGFIALLVAAASLTTGQAQSGLLVDTDSASYNAGSQVFLRISSPASRQASVDVSVRYAGSSTPSITGIRVPVNAGYVPVWKIPAEPVSGRYEIDLNGENGRVSAASFVVYRKIVQVIRLEVEHGSYVEGEMVHSTLTIQNLSSKAIMGLRAEIAAQYYPWIAPAPGEGNQSPVTISDSLALNPGEERSFSVSMPAPHPTNREADAITYTATVWDHARTRLYDLAFSNPVFLYPLHDAGGSRAYPHVFLYPRLDLLRQEAVAYRQFYPPDYVSGLVDFNIAHTSFPAGTAPVINFEIHNPRTGRCESCSARLRVWRKDHDLVSSSRTNLGVDRSWKLSKSVSPLPPGLYVAEVQLMDSREAVLASNRLEFAVNSLPKSILFVGAHEDDDTAYPAYIRSAIENHIPIHFLFLTAGEAGGCERFYARSCDAERALQFGETRMEEARQSLGHLGVPAGSISFLGLPDGGVEDIWAGADGDVYPAALLGSDHAPYASLRVPNLAYSRRAALDALKDAIREFQPQMIITAHPDERHADHRTACWFTIKALQELLKEKAVSPDTVVVADQSYGPVSANAAPYRYEKEVLHVPGEVARLGQEAQWFYQTQDGNRQQGELKTFDKLPREEVHWKILDWQEHEGWNEKGSH